MEKIYVALGNDLQEGFRTLEWVLRKWPPIDNPMIGGLVLVHASRNISKEFVYGPCKCKRENSFSGHRLLAQPRGPETLQEPVEPSQKVWTSM